VQKVRSE